MPTPRNESVAIAKIALGYSSGAVSILSDGFHSLTDSASNVVALIGVSIARRPPDQNHPYGHRKYETMASLGITLFLVLVLVEISDVIFAVDSIPAVFAVTEEPFLVFASNALAILGLRAMYFLVADLIDRFVYLKVGLAFVMMWVGVKMLIVSWVKIPVALSLSVVVGILAVAIIASLYKTREVTSLRT